MAKYILCCVRDSVADVYGNPFCTQSTGMAVRSFTDQVNRVDAENPMHMHAEDFALFEVGEFDNETCEFNLLPRPRQLVLGKDVKKVTQ